MGFIEDIAKQKQNEQKAATLDNMIAQQQQQKVYELGANEMAIAIARRNEEVRRQAEMQDLQGLAAYTNKPAIGGY